MSREGLSPWWIGGVLGVVVLASVGVWYMLVQRAPMVEAPPQMVGANSSTDEDASAAVPVTSPPPPADLPPLDESDERVREMALELSTHPKLVKWLAPDDLVRRMVASVDNLSRGNSPRAHLEHMRPEEGFGAAVVDGAVVLDPESYARYDLLTEVFTSLDIGATVRLYYELEPLFEEAYNQLGHPSRSFSDALDEAIARLIDTPIPEGKLEVEKHLLVYRFTDPLIESMSPAEKHLVRLGPENARKVKSKLTFLRSALDLGRRSQTLLQREAAAEKAETDSDAG